MSANRVQARLFKHKLHNHALNKIKNSLTSSVNNSSYIDPLSTLAVNTRLPRSQAHQMTLLISPRLAGLELILEIV